MSRGGHELGECDVRVGSSGQGALCLGGRGCWWGSPGLLQLEQPCRGHRAAWGCCPGASRANWGCADTGVDFGQLLPLSPSGLCSPTLGSCAGGGTGKGFLLLPSLRTSSRPDSPKLVCQHPLAAFLLLLLFLPSVGGDLFPSCCTGWSWDRVPAPCARAPSVGTVSNGDTKTVGAGGHRKGSQVGKPPEVTQPSPGSLGGSWQGRDAAG